jgi:beta-glucanase (GH16 family)
LAKKFLISNRSLLVGFAVSGFTLAAVVAFNNCGGFSAGSSGVSGNSQANSASAGTSATGSSNNVSNSAGSSSTPSSNSNSGNVVLNDPNVIFSEEFNTLSIYDPKTDKGTWEVTGNGNSNAQGTAGWGDEFNINPLTQTLGINPFSLSNGVLSIALNPIPANLASQLENKKFTSGGLKGHGQNFGYGYYEIKAQLPAGAGNWPAFWLLPSTPDSSGYYWPPEIDIFELLECDPTTMWMTVHSEVNFPGSVNYSPAWQGGPPHYQLGNSATVADTTAGFHTYGVDFRANSITWYFDRVQKATAPTPSDLVNRPMYIVINNAANGGWSCNNTFSSSSTFPTIYQIDYVRVYDKKPF